ncbi:MAG: hypothetical protein IKU08_01010 [Clostridia bacterium]|nr:hypothetical protein [Clostridia bacterium]
MGEIFRSLLNISVTAVYIILATVLVRMIFRNMPRKYLCLLWGITGLRLALPFSIESALSLIPSRETFTVYPYSGYAVRMNSGMPAVDSAVNGYISNVEIGWVHVPLDNPEPAITSRWDINAYIWLAGALIILLYGIISYIRVKRSVSTAVLLEGSIMQCEIVKSPFILGVFKPKVYIPFNIDEATRNHVIAHENAHIRRFDHVTKPLSFILLAVYWFNPFVWLAYILFCRDIEKACDEKVVDSMDGESRKAYATALLQCAAGHRRITASPLAFGEVSVKGRIKSVMNYKKPAFWVVVISVVLCIVAAVCFLTSPETPNEKFYDNGQRIKITAETNGFVTEEKYIILKAGQNTELSNGTEFTLVFSNLQTGEITLALDGTQIYDERFVKAPDVITLDMADKFNYLTQDGKTKINISCAFVGSLDDCISEAIVEHNKGNYIDGGDYVCEAHEILSTEITKKDKNGNIKEVTVYLVQAYCEYMYETNTVVETGGSGSALALTFEVTDTSHYKLKEYWEPDMGRGYAESIREKFPADCAEIAIKGNEPFDECDRMAQEHYNAEFAEFTIPATTRAHFMQGVTVDNCTFTAVGYSESGREYFRENGIEKYTFIEFTESFGWNNGTFHIVRIDTKADFDEFIKGAEKHFNFQSGFNGDVPFEKIANRYNERFFEKNTLYLGYIVDGSISSEFSFINFYETYGDDDPDNIHVMHMNIQKTGPEAGDTAMGGWIVSVEAEKSNLPDTPLAIGFVRS